jgi:hypothetical protein
MVTADAEAIAFLRRRLHADLADYTEYLGSLALVVPDPVLRGMHHYFGSEEDKRFERLVYRLLPRAPMWVSPRAAATSISVSSTSTTPCGTRRTSGTTDSDR